MKGDKYDINVPKAVGKLLPFWARGRKTCLFLAGILEPLRQTHSAWVNWAVERLIEAAVTYQPISLEWYLNHVFRRRFADPDASFAVFEASAPTNVIYTESEYFEADEHSQHIYCMSEEAEDLTMTVYKRGEVPEFVEGIAISAPAINQNSQYDNEDYVKDIESVIKKYDVTFRQHQINISST